MVVILSVCTCVGALGQPDNSPLRTDNPRTPKQACMIVCLRLYVYKKLLLDTLDELDDDEIIIQQIQAEFVECGEKCNDIWE